MEPVSEACGQFTVVEDHSAGDAVAYRFGSLRRPRKSDDLTVAAALISTRATAASPCSITMSTSKPSRSQ